jgi:hypothetical protein
VSDVEDLIAQARADLRASRDMLPERRDARRRLSIAEGLNAKDADELGNLAKRIEDDPSLQATLTPHQEIALGMLESARDANQWLIDNKKKRERD